MNKNLLLEKYIKVAVRKALQEQEEQQMKAEKAMYLVYRFPGLKKVMEDLMSPSFGRYINDIQVIAPKPTTFNVMLINNESFYITYIGRGNFRAKIAGKKYDPINISEQERASQSIADLLTLNYSPVEGKEEDKQQTITTPNMDKELAADLASADTSTPAPTTPPETTPGEIPSAPETAPKETPPEEEETPA
jgi:hypothetical protein